MTEITQADREAAASVAVLPEMRDLIRAGRADYHAEPFARHREAERAAIVAWLRESAAWHDKHDDGLSGFDGIRQGQTEAADAIEAGEHHD